MERRRRRGHKGSGRQTKVIATVYIQVICSVCVYYCRTYYKAVRGGGRRRVEDMCYERRRAEACVDESAHHALAWDQYHDSVMLYSVCLYPHWINSRGS